MNRPLTGESRGLVSVPHVVKRLPAARLCRSGRVPAERDAVGPELGDVGGGWELTSACRGIPRSRGCIAELLHRSGEWIVIDDGLSQNGTLVNRLL